MLARYSGALSVCRFRSIRYYAPNHVHGIIFISPDDVGVQNFEPLQGGGQRENRFQHIIPKSLGSIVRGFKIGVTKWYRKNTDIDKVWQRGYFDRVIRDEDELNRIREYILQNASKWAEDKENPEKVKASTSS